MKRIYNLLVGFTITFGKCMFGLLVLGMIWDKSIVNYDNTLFITILTAVGWIIGLVYELDFNIHIRGSIHSISLYLISLGVFLKIYGILGLKEYFIIWTIIYWIIYLVSYAMGLYYFQRMGADLNDTVEFIKKFENKYTKRKNRVRGMEDYDECN